MISHGAEQFLQQYGKDVNLKSVFPATLQSSMAEKDWTESGLPTLRQAAEAIGGKKVLAWLVAQLTYINEMIGPDKPLSTAQLMDAAMTIQAEYSDLTFQGFMTFFHRLKLGRYGRFYGSMDVMVIMCGLAKFVEETREIVGIRNAEAKQREFDEWKKRAVSYEQYLEIKKRAEEGDEQARRLLRI